MAIFSLHLISTTDLMPEEVSTGNTLNEVQLVLRLARPEDISVLCCAVRLIVDDKRLTQISMLPIQRKKRMESELIHARQAAEKAVEERAQALAELEQAKQQLSDITSRRPD